MPLARPAKAQPAIVSWSGDWRCGCGSSNKLWDTCVCGQASPCREYVRGNCLLPKCRFPHPPFKIPEHLPKPSDPIANPPAAAAKQKAAAQAAAAALAAEQTGPKEMAIVTWLGHWQCDCGKVHKLWDSCKCGQAPPCREWVRGQCNISKCRFPHPPFAIPANLPKPDDPIANPTGEQLVWSKEHLAGNGNAKLPGSAANGQSGASSGDSTPVGGVESSGDSVSGDAAGGLANGSADKAAAAAAPPPPSAIMQPGVSFRQALLKSQQQQQEAAAAAAAAAGGDSGDFSSAAGMGLPPPPPPPPPMDQPPPPPPPPAVAMSPRSSASGGFDQQVMMSPRSLASAHMLHHHQLHQQQHQQQNGLSAADPVTAAPLSARSDPQVTVGLGGGWNPLGGGSLLSSVAPAATPAPQPPTPAAALAPPAPVAAPQPSAAQQQAALAAMGGPGGNPAAGGPPPHMMGSLASPTAAAAAQQQVPGGSAAQFTLQQALQQMALQQAAAAQAKAQQQAAAAAQQQQQQAAAAAQQKPLRAIAHTLLEGGLMDPAFYHALGQVDFLPDGHYQQDSITLEDQQRRMEVFNSAVDSYIAAGVDRRSMLEIECAAKIGLSGGPLYYRCATCGNPMSERMRPSWCAGCKATPFCSQDCLRVLYAQHRGVCSSMLTKPLLPSQIALRMAVEVHTVHGAGGAALQQAVLRQMGAVQRSYQAAAAAAAAAGVVDE
ncbi:hypothetical protein ACK3TF_001293 [Chlorella vulgaris]